MSTRTRRGTRGTAQSVSAEKPIEPDPEPKGVSTRLRRAASNAEVANGATGSKFKSYASEGVLESKTSVPARPKRNGASSKVDRMSDRNISILSQYSQLSQARNQNQVIFFVLPEGTNEATCEPNLSTAYLLCQDHCLSSEWIKEEDCLKKQPVQGNIFVFSPFAGPAFTYLEGFREKGCYFEIIGPQCIRYSLQDKADCPIVTCGYPAFTMGMRDTLISLSGVTEERKKSLTTTIQLMNGNVTSSLTLAVSHVVADNVLSEKCAVAFKRKIPVMTVDWIEAVWNDSQENLVHGSDPKYVKFACPIFHNLVICVSSVTVDRKNALRNAIEANGGVYSADLTRQNTSVLVVPNDSGTKYRYAQQWKLPCVTPDWVDESKSVGHVLPLKNFAVFAKTSTPCHSMIVPLEDQSSFNAVSNVGSAQPNCRQTTFCGEESAISPIELEELLKKAARNGPYLDGCKIYVSGANKLEQIRKFLNVSGATRLDRLDENVTHVLVTEKRVPPADLQVLRGLDNLPSVLTVDWLIESAKKGSPAEEQNFIFGPSSRTSVILETSEETSHGSQKSKHRSISDLVEGRRTDPELLLASKLAGTSKSTSIEQNGISSPNANDNLDPRVVTLHQNPSPDQPPVDTTTTTNEAPVEGNVSVPEQNIPSMGCDDRDQQENPENAMEIFQKPPSTSPQSESSVSSQDSDATRDTRSQSNDSVFPFAGRRIKIEINDEEERSDLENLIKDANGELVEDDFEIIILPVIHSADLQFSKAKCFTKQWVTDCIENDCFEVNVAYFHKPLRAFDGMLDVLSEVVVAISQYANLEKEYLTAIVTAMGGIVQDVFARKASKTSGTLRTTHLICPSTSNDKFRAAKKWGTPVVVAGWILDCYKNKHIVDTTSYSPELINDSDSILSYMPRTPKYTTQKKNLKQGRTNGTMASVMSNFPPSVEKPQISSANVQVNPVNLFKTPSRIESKVSTPGASSRVAQLKQSDFERLRSDSFDEYVAAGNGLEPIDLKSMETPSFLAYLEEERAAGRLVEREESFALEGYTKEETRNLVLAYEMAGYNSPAPQGIYIKKRNSTPLHVVTARCWKQMMESYPVSSGTNSPATSTPNINDYKPLPCRKVSSAKEVAEGAIGSNRIKSLNKSSSGSERSSVKRSSDSSVEEEDIILHPKGFAKRRRLSTESESSQQEQNDNSRSSAGGEGYNGCNQYSTTSSGEGIVQEQMSTTGSHEMLNIFMDVVVWIERDCPEYESIVSCVTSIGGRIAVDVADEDITHIVVQRYNPELMARAPRTEIVLPSWIFACKASSAIVDENRHKPQQAIASSSKSMKALKNLLTEGDDEASNDGVGPSQFQVPAKLKKSSNSMMYNGHDQEQINPEEMDAPHIVWENDDQDSDVRSIQMAAMAEKENRNEFKSVEETALSDAGSSKTCGEKKQMASKAQRRHERTPAAPAVNIIRNRKYPELPPNPIFMLSGLGDDDKVAASEAIKLLGGRVSNTSEFNPKACGIVSTSLARSEKTLGCVASGKYLIKLEYLIKCKEAKKYLPLEDSFLWQNTDAKKPLEKEIAEAANLWRARCTKNPEDTPMNGLIFYFDGASAGKKEAYTRLIKAGGGQVTANAEEATIIISDRKNNESSNPKFPNLPIHPAMYLNTLILPNLSRGEGERKSYE